MSENNEDHNSPWCHQIVGFVHLTVQKIFNFKSYKTLKSKSWEQRMYVIVICDLNN